ncbi:hypothetical protein GCM10009851_04310 [Herbiconiux moechotypicola]|uniref:Uncharacterized protein n=1 Tax=Herbiconiux moechotypicola TaxID=637393 RepID=A0ABN3D942_9MICO
MLAASTVVVAVAIAAAAPAAATAAPLPASAPAVSAGSLADPLAVLGAIAPELLDDTRIPAGAGTRADLRAAGAGTAFDVEIPADPSSALSLTPTETEGSGLPVAITIGGAEGQAKNHGGITAYSGGHDSAAYVQPVENGVRLLTALASPAAGSDFSYDFALPDGAYPTELPTGETLLSDAAHHYIGTLEAPWARDATGRELATSYSWSGHTLIQHVELAADTAFPVLLDPLWLYSYDFSTTSTGWAVNHPKATEGSVSRLLHGCFNCWFPIFGAPRSYPADGQILPLSITPFTWSPTAAPVRSQTANGGALQFVALDGHFDGAGSVITFSWYNDPSGYLHLYVHAMVMKDNGPYLNVLNARAAGANWLLYWKKVADNANGTSGGGGV